MKKKLKGLIVCLIILLIVIQIKKIYLKEYVITYKINSFNITEQYQMNNKNHNYHIIISNQNKTFIYDINHDFHKNKKVIKNIKTFKRNDLVCIIPQYKKNNINKLYCIINKEQVSNDYLIKSNNKDFIELKNKLKKYKVKLPKSIDERKKYKKIIIYQNNILDKDIYYLWDYKGIYILDKENYSYKKILTKDLYDNVMSTTINNYYVLFDNTSVKGIDKVYYYNHKNSKVKEFKLKTSLSKDTYINGTFNDLIYITDKKNKKQYSLNIEQEEIKRIDKDETKYVIYEKQRKYISSKSDFFMKEQIFNEKVIRDTYYIENNKMYKILDASKKKRILLFELDDIKEWWVDNNQIIILKNDTVYSYSEDNGLRKIIQSNELNYNYKNIYKIGEK